MENYLQKFLLKHILKGGIGIKKSLCKHCDVCEDLEYVRFDRNGNLQCFQYCKGGAEEVGLSEWYIQKDGYAYSTARIKEGKKTFYHTLFKKDNDMVIDHVDGDRTDNRLRMLREITPSCNSQNIRWEHKRIVSKFPGVYYNRKTNTWRCQARRGGSNNPNKQHVSKSGFETEYEAFDCYLSILKEMGRTINTETDAYKDYLKWKGEKQQSTLEAFI